MQKQQQQNDSTQTDQNQTFNQFRFQTEILPIEWCGAHVIDLIFIIYVCMDV